MTAWSVLVALLLLPVALVGLFVVIWLLLWVFMLIGIVVLSAILAISRWLS